MKRAIQKVIFNYYIFTIITFSQSFSQLSHYICMQCVSAGVWPTSQLFSSCYRRVLGVTHPGATTVGRLLLFLAIFPLSFLSFSALHHHHVKERPRGHTAHTVLLKVYVCVFDSCCQRAAPAVCDNETKYDKMQPACFFLFCFLNHALKSCTVKKGWNTVAVQWIMHGIHYSYTHKCIIQCAKKEKKKRKIWCSFTQ